jgi:hypothetical protein
MEIIWYSHFKDTHGIKAILNFLFEKFLSSRHFVKFEIFYIVMSVMPT